MVFDNAEVIFSYTTEDATRDGILFDVASINPEWRTRSLFSHITTNLLRTHDYLVGDGDERKIKLPNVLDLLNQALQSMKQQTANFTTEPQTCYVVHIEAPSGEQIEIWIEMNEVEINAPRYTILLPEDH